MKSRQHVSYNKVTVVTAVRQNVVVKTHNSVKAHLINEANFCIDIVLMTPRMFSRDVIRKRDSSVV